MGSVLSNVTKCGTGEEDTDDYENRPFDTLHAEKNSSSNKRHKDPARTFSESMRLNNSNPRDFYGFHFNNDGRLVDKKGHGFNFSKQKEIEGASFYPELCEEIMNFVQESLISFFNLEKIAVPVGAVENVPQSFIFASRNALITTDKLLILIHGSGNVVAGIWSRKVIVTDSLYKGSQIAYVEKALSEGYEIVILNTNVNSKVVLCETLEVEAPIFGSESPKDHAVYVWDNFICRSKARHVAVVSHSYGGVVTTHLACERRETFMRRVFAVAFTDSVHQLDQKRMPNDVFGFFCDNARNWVSSNLPLDTCIGKGKRQPLSDALKVSAGDDRHEWTTHSACNSVFAFLREKYEIRISRLRAASSVQTGDRRNIS